MKRRHEARISLRQEMASLAACKVMCPIVHGLVLTSFPPPAMHLSCRRAHYQRNFKRHRPLGIKGCRKRLDDLVPRKTLASPPPSSSPRSRRGIFSPRKKTSHLYFDRIALHHGWSSTCVMS